MLTRAEHRFSGDITDGRLHLHTASMTQLPLADGSLDGVITLNTIYFISELHRAFTELARVVKQSGRVIVGVGDPNAMAKMPVTAHGFRLRPIPEVIDALRGAGLTVVDAHGEDDALRPYGSPQCIIFERGGAVARSPRSTSKCHTQTRPRISHRTHWAGSAYGRPSPHVLPWCV